MFLIKFGIFAWYINVLSLFLHLDLSFGTNFTIIYDSTFGDTLTVNLLKKPKEISLLQVDDQTDDLKHITTALNNVSRYSVVFMFTKRDAFFEKFLQNQHLVLKYGITIKDAMKNVVAEHENSLCNSFNTYTKRSLTMLIYSLRHQSTTIVTNEEDCANDIYSTIETSIFSHQHYNQMKLQLQHIVYRENHPNFYQDLIDVDLIILLTSVRHSNTILIETFNRNPKGSTLWIVPSLHYYAKSLQWNPQKILTFEIHATDKAYWRLGTTVTHLLDYYDERSNNSRQDVALKMYHAIQRIEEEERHHTDVICLDLRYSDTYGNLSGAVGKINQHSFILYNNSIPVLLPVTEVPLKNFLKAVTILDSPYSIERIDAYDHVLSTCKLGLKCQKPRIINGSVEYEPTCCTGFVIEVFLMVMKYTGIQVDLYITIDNSYGGKGDDGSWNGMVGEIVNGKADIAIGGLSVIKDRSKVVNFTELIMEETVGILLDSKFLSENLIIYFNIPISSNLQMGLLIIIIVTTLIFYIFENTVYHAKQLIYNMNHKKKYYAMRESMTYIFGVVLQRDLGGVNPRKLGTRLVAVLFAFTMVVLVTTYTAMLAAENIQHTEKNLFLGLKDSRMRNPTSAFRFAVKRKTSFETFFKSNEKYIFRKMFDFMKKYNVDSVTDGVKRVNEGNLEAFIFDYHFLHWYIASNGFCHLRIQMETMFTEGLAFAVRDNLEVLPSINTVIREHQAKIAQIRNEWFVSSCDVIASSHRPESQGISDFSGMIVLLCITALACFPLLIPEYFYHKYLKAILIRPFKRISIRKTLHN